MTKINKVYLARVIGRIICFVIMTVLILFEMFGGVDFFNIQATLEGFGFFTHLSPLHIVWILLMHYMIIDLFNTKVRHPGSAKSFGRRHIKKSYDNEELKKTKKFYDRGAFFTAISFLALNIVIGTICFLLKYFDVFNFQANNGKYGLILLIFQLFYFASDFICVMFFCPFQSWMMKNRCCRTCRIFNWGAVMIEVPMMIYVILFGPSFYAISLSIMGIIIFLKWEIILLKYPERFFQVSNKYLSCKSCKDPFCKIKPRVHSKYRNDNNIL